MTSQWTEAKTEQVIAMWQADQSCGTIGRAIGISASAVAGKINRLRLAGRDVPMRLRSRKTRVYAKAKPKRLDPTDRGDLRQFPELKPLPAVTSLGAKGCQWIYGDVPKWPDEPVMCGRARKGGLAYCKVHRRRCMTAFIPRGLRVAKKAVAPSYRVAGALG